MKKKALLSSSDRTRIASSLYKLAIRVMQMSKRPLDPAKVSNAINASRERVVSRMIKNFSSAKGQGALQIVKPPSIQKVLATRTTVPEQGDGIRVDILVGPFFLLEDKNKDLGIICKDTVIRPGLPPEDLYPLEKLYNLAENLLFGGVLPQSKLPVVDARDVSDKPFALDHSYDNDIGDKAWKVVHTSGPKKGQVAMYENASMVGKQKANKDSEIETWIPAVFRTGTEASKVLNQLTRGTSHSSRTFPKFREYTTFLKYSSVHLKSDSAGLYSVFDLLLSEADSSSNQETEGDKKAIIQEALEWLRERSVNPATLLATLENKNPEMAKKLRSVFPAIEEAWSLEQDSSQESTLKKIVAILKEHKLTPDTVLSSMTVKNPTVLREFNKILPSSNIATLVDKVGKLIPSLERIWARQSLKEAV